MPSCRRVLAVLLAAAALGLVVPGVAQADEECHVIDGRGAGQAISLTETIATIRGAGLLTGATTGTFVYGEPVGVVRPFTGTVEFTANRATLAVGVTGALTLTSAQGDLTFEATSTGFTGTGKLEGATGDLRLEGIGVPSGAFTETVTGTICVDLAP